jgi:uncharacterized Zn finger protein
MIKLTAETMTKAIERAKAVRPRVRVLSATDRTYSVTGSKGDSYTVRFAVANGNKLGECDCQAGQLNHLCYHVAAAAQVNVMIHSMRQQGASAPVAPLAPRVSRRIERGHNGAKVVAVYCDGWAV